MHASPVPEHELRYEGVLLTADVIAEERNGRTVVSIPRHDVVRMDLARGAAGERLALQVLFALMLVAIGIASTASLIGELRHAMVIHVNLAAGCLFVPVGGLVLWLAFRPRYHLRIQTKKELRKIGFDAAARPEGLASFLGLARRVHGYEVTSTLPTGVPYR